MSQALVVSSPLHAFEDALHHAVERGTSGAPPKLRAAIEHAIFPGGARLRPLLCMAVAHACGSDDAIAPAIALELMHCASLVHDDLPCFDDAEIRRGRPTVARLFGEAAAVLVGDALIVLALDRVGHAPELVRILADAAGPARGLVAGQAWELEADVPLARYHRAKTSALFEAAAMMGASVASTPAEAWRAFGESIGHAYQAADDIADVRATSDKTTGRDVALDRPSVVRAFGIEVARRKVQTHLSEAARRVPLCKHRESIVEWLRVFSARVGHLQR